MNRRIELLSGLMACTVGLIVVISISIALNATAAWGVGGDAQRDNGIAAILLVGVALGAYLHAVWRLRAGLVLLWFSSGALLVGAAYAILAPGALYSVSPLLGMELIGLAPTLIAVALILSVVSAVSAITPSFAFSPDAEPSDEEQAPGRSFLAGLLHR